MVVKAGAFRALSIEQNWAMGRLHIEIIRQRARRCSGRRGGSSVGAGGGPGWADGTAAAPVIWALVEEEQRVGPP